MDEVQTSELRDLLLHKLPPSRAAELEDMLLRDSGFGARLESEENDLLDDFARGHLDAEDVELVDRYLLATSYAQHRLEFAKSLARVAASSPVSHKGIARSFRNSLRTPAFGIGLAACVALLVFAIVALRRQPAHHEVASDQKQAAQTPSAPPSGFTAPSTDGKAAQSFAIFLPNENRRGSQPRTYAIPAGVNQLVIQCEIPELKSSSKFNIVLRSAAGNSAVNLNGLGVRKSTGVNYIEARLPTDQIRSGRYSASVFTATDPTAHVVTYDFTVTLGLH